MRFLVRTLSTFLLLAGVLRGDALVPAWPASAGEPSPAATAPDQWKAWVAGRPAEILDVRQPGDPLILLLVMDTVGDLNRVEAARRSLRETLGSMPPEWRVALLRAMDGPAVIVEPTGDGETLMEEIHGLAISGFPGLLDAVGPVAGIADSIMAGSCVRVAALFITDGAIESYRGDFTSTVVNQSDNRDLSRRFNDQIIQERINSLAGSLQNYAAPLFFVHLQERTAPEERAYQNGIQEFARVSGGQAYFARNLADVQTVIGRALDRIAGQYVVRVATPAESASPVNVRLEPRVGQPSLTYRQSASVSAQGPCLAASQLHETVPSAALRLEKHPAVVWNSAPHNGKGAYNSTDEGSSPLEELHAVDSLARPENARDIGF